VGVTRLGKNAIGRMIKAVLISVSEEAAIYKTARHICEGLFDFQGDDLSKTEATYGCGQEAFAYLMRLFLFNPTV